VYHMHRLNLPRSLKIASTAMCSYADDYFAAWLGSPSYDVLFVRESQLPTVLVNTALNKYIAIFKIRNFADGPVVALTTLDAGQEVIARFGGDITASEYRLHLCAAPAAESTEAIKDGRFTAMCEAMKTLAATARRFADAYDAAATAPEFNSALSNAADAAEDALLNATTEHVAASDAWAELPRFGPMELLHFPL
jgi:hypothetical protein